ncbi:DUF4145 domain-containing protein [Coxiella burnetii]|uniref:DUF4145 domain-containing protein n=1 Tax=Coxiella burnetii TaxID=777 RepID=UPI00222FDCF9|nr:DUF4145 domain-containing protein [Coxiella burnetii]
MKRKKDKVDVDKIQQTIEFYIDQAEKCASHGLYFSACVTYGAALEGMLLSFFLCNLTDDDEMPSLQEVRSVDLYSMIEECVSNNVFNQSKIIPEIQSNLIHDIREIRNLIDPSRRSYFCKKIDRNMYAKVKNTFDDIAEHLFYWMTGDCEIE